MDHKMSTGLKRKHHGEKKEERRGRPRKIDKERSLMSTPVTHVHVCTKKLCKCLVWRRDFFNKSVCQNGFVHYIVYKLL